ncbi:ABC transporter ATP-binding protein [Ketogulonicigenium vulgare]|uniref:ABC transporter nucleotide binding/ATPase protein n=1 Tax=Ketogulonicigenium vulgare (strain WSH-001) TaxID=759362 RepID=F9Y794_KETVW|nr:ABC transporter ATP-binding protein [Ketogulonicigenium vulgare]ADO42836.1 ABC transporter nucleotide binding/ATPase protein [Ketogulonicigenium vulgare Y25]AEM41022.1 ABC transporter nucleotide binding/ATPase protein [Ketogulonicigenium vulgare WSH-001]ALJ81172.1 ABC transporter ATP-binding protein [Ketogulonicigenium vulgare]ANW33918.1 ABC transporter ATP-binding protein [Ketogulonicigenium vulgare]AOZ54749.1 oligopeptide transport ATP-binding protein OppD [Ketogulonicigenium vulgare]
MTPPVLKVDNLVVDFPLRRGTSHVLRGVSFEIAAGEVLGVVGESGAGKSMTGSAVIKLIEPPGQITSGEVYLTGQRIDQLPEEEMAKLRGKRIGLVTQDPLTSLNPLFTIGDQLIETIRQHMDLSVDKARERAVSLLSEAGIPDAASRIDAYPHQFSGGMRQRVVIALAIAAEPELVIADEPTSALDVSVQKQIIQVLKDLCARRGTAIMLITHDMGVIAQIADRVMVMNLGQVVETGPVGQIIRNPQADYTKKLIASIPTISRGAVAAAAEIAAPRPDTHVAVEDLVCDFNAGGGVIARLFGKGATTFRAVDKVSFSIPRGKTYGLVGESGSGKSTCARMIAGLIRPTAGRVLVGGQDVWADREGAEQRRRNVQMIFQDPYASLNPRWRVKDIIAEPLRALGLSKGGSEMTDRVAELLREVRLDPAVMDKFPHEFSGGQRQRIAIARALSSQPAFIVCDEPTSALDVSVQAQVLDLMARLQEEHGLTYLLISHNLAVIRQMALDVGVLHRGVLVESGPVDQIFDNPQADYTKMLLDAVPDLDAVA